MIERLKIYRDAYRRRLSAAAYAVLCISSIVFAMTVVSFLPGKYVYAPPSTTNTVAGTAADRYFLRASLPTRLIIPKLSIDTSFEMLGLNADKTIGIPKEYTTVGWYTGSPTPGELGPSIVLGHIDSYQGPAIFYHLGKLAPGDMFTIEREDGSIATFEVEKLERYKQSEFPTDLVYGPITYAGIRLITCSGTYDKGVLRYSHNLVVYGRLVNPATDTPS